MNYLIVSNYYRLNNILINQFVNKDSEIIKMDINNSTAEEIISELKYDSLFNSKKSIVVYNCIFFSSNKLDDSTLELIISYLKNPNPNNNLIFIQNENVDNRKKISKVMKENGKILDYSKIKYNDLLKFVDDYIKMNHWHISNDIINYLVKAFNSNYDLICNELDKLKIAFPNDVSFEDAKLIISNNISDNIFKFVDEVVSHNFSKSMILLKDLKTSKIEATIIINMLYRELRFIYLYKFSKKYQIDIELFFKSEGLMDWQINKIIENSKFFSYKEISRSIMLLSEYDYKYKSGKVDRDLVVEMFLLEFIC